MSGVSSATTGTDRHKSRSAPLSLALGLAGRELRSRYQESALGFAWSVLSPLLLMALYTVFFGKMLGQEQEAGGMLGFTLHLFSGYLVWDTFARLAGDGPDILLANRAILTKVRIPIDAVFHARMLQQLFHTAIAAVLLLVVALVAGRRPGAQVLLLPLTVLLLSGFTLGVTMVVSVLGLFLRDLKEVTALLLAAWLFLTPIFYRLERMPALAPDQALGIAYRCNPQFWFVALSRAATLGDPLPSPLPLLALAVVSAASYWLGRRFLRRCRSLILDTL